MRPYCTPRDCMGYGDLLACDGCRLEAACNAMAVGLCIAGLLATLTEFGAHLAAASGRWDLAGSVDFYAAANGALAKQAGIVLP